MDECSEYETVISTTNRKLNLVPPEFTNSPRVGFIPSATVRPITFVKLKDPLSRATTLMKLYDFSQLPVVNGGGTRPVGAISWESIGQKLSDNPRATLQDCVDRDAPVVRLDDELLTAIEKINKTGFVIVTGSNGEISGIVTSADLGQALADIARPFVLVERCENELRKIVVELLESGQISRVEIDALISRPKMSDSASPNDLTFGDLVAVVTAQSVWTLLNTNYDRIEVKQALDRASKLRNTLMHFRERNNDFVSASHMLPQIASVLSAIRLSANESDRGARRVDVD